MQQSDRDIRNDPRVVDVAEIYGAHVRTIRVLVGSFMVRNAAAGRRLANGRYEFVVENLAQAGAHVGAQLLSA